MLNGICPKCGILTNFLWLLEGIGNEDPYFACSAFHAGLGARMLSFNPQEGLEYRSSTAEDLLEKGEILNPGEEDSTVKDYLNGEIKLKIHTPIKILAPSGIRRFLEFGPHLNWLIKARWKLKGWIQEEWEKG